MAKKDKTAPANDVKETPVAKTEAAVAPVAGAKPADGAEAKPAAAPKTRGPRGTSEAAVIKLLVTTNPKRPNSKAFAAFANYKDGMTVKEFCDAVGKEATGHLVYDAKHGSISIEGYDPGAIITPKPKAPPKPKAEKKAKKEKAPVDETLEANKAALEQETAEETME